MIFFLNPDQGSPSTLEDKCRKVKFQGSRKIMKAPVVKRQAAKISILKRNLDSQGMQAFKEKQNAEEREKNRRKSETKRNPKKK